MAGNSVVGITLAVMGVFEYVDGEVVSIGKAGWGVGWDGVTAAEAVSAGAGLAGVATDGVLALAAAAALSCSSLGRGKGVSTRSRRHK